MSKKRNLTPRELATILAALRFWQKELHTTNGEALTPAQSLMAWHFDNEAGLSPLTPDEIDGVCVLLNTGEIDRELEKTFEEAEQRIDDLIDSARTLATQTKRVGAPKVFILDTLEAIAALEKTKPSRLAQFTEAARHIGFGTDRPIDGASAVELINGHFFKHK